MSVLRLPSEMLEEVSSYLCDHDLQQWRLTCRDFAAVAPSPMCNPCFLVSDRWAMSKLLELSSHAVFAHRVKSISFSDMKLKRPEARR